MVKPRNMSVFSVITYLFMIARCQDYSSNYINSKEICHNRGGLITQKMLKCSGLINTTCELSVNNSVLKDGESVWMQGRAQTGPYIALHTCMRFSNQGQHLFARKRTFNTNILFECSVFCDQILHSGYLGIYKDSCFCMYEFFRFPYASQCLGLDLMDIQKGIIVFRLIKANQFKIQSKSDLNCLGALFQESGKTLYYNTKCASTLYSICTQRVDNDLSNKCLPRLGEFCFNQEKGTFLENLRKCWYYNGTLIPFNSGIIVSLNYSVMLGSFRTFKAIAAAADDEDYDEDENNGNVTWLCLSITQLNGTIYLETENCSYGKKILCIDDIQETPNKGESDTKDDVTTHTQLICFLIPLLIIVSCISIAIMLCRKSTGNPQTETQQQSDEISEEEFHSIGEHNYRSRI